MPRPASPRDDVVRPFRKRNRSGALVPELAAAFDGPELSFAGSTTVGPDPRWVELARILAREAARDFFRAERDRTGHDGENPAS